MPGFAARGDMCGDMWCGDMWCGDMCGEKLLAGRGDMWCGEKLDAGRGDMCGEYPGVADLGDMCGDMCGIPAGELRGEGEDGTDGGMPGIAGRCCKGRVLTDGGAVLTGVLTVVKGALTV